MSSSSRMCDATPLANAAAAADARPAPNIVDSFDAPNPAATCCARRAGLSMEPPSAEPSQSAIDRRVCSRMSAGRSVYFVDARTSANTRVRSSDTEILQPFHDDREVHHHVDDAEEQPEQP